MSRHVCIYSSLSAHATEKTIQCLGCEMQRFKSAVCEARQGNASLNIQEWDEFLQYSREPQYWPYVVDILICQNNRCGLYNAVYYHGVPWERNISLWVCGLSITSNKISLHRSKTLSEMDTLPLPLANIVVDFLLPLEGRFRPPSPTLVPTRQTHFRSEPLQGMELGLGLDNLRQQGKIGWMYDPGDVDDSHQIQFVDQGKGRIVKLFGVRPSSSGKAIGISYEFLGHDEGPNFKVDIVSGSLVTNFERE